MVIVSLHVATGAAMGALTSSRLAALALGPPLHLGCDWVPHEDIADRRFEIRSGLFGLALLALSRGPLDPVTLGACSAAAPDLEHISPRLRPHGRKLFHGVQGEEAELGGGHEGASRRPWAGASRRGGHYTKEVTVSNSLPPVQVVTDRYVLSGEITIGAVPGDTVDLCAAQRAAVEAKKQEVASLQHRVMSLQQQLQHATPQQKPAIIHEIGATNDLIDQAEAALPALEAALNACLAHFHNHVDPNDVVVVSPGG